MQKLIFEKQNLQSDFDKFKYKKKHIIIIKKKKKKKRQNEENKKENIFYLLSYCIANISQFESKLKGNIPKETQENPPTQPNDFE